MGAASRVIPVGRDGMIDEAALNSVLAEGPALVAIQQVNNETGIDPAASSIIPSPPTGITRDAAPIAWWTIACSVAPCARPATLARAATISTDSLAPLVKMTS